MSDIEKLVKIEYIYLQGVKHLETAKVELKPEINKACYDYIKKLISLELAKELNEAEKSF